MVSMQNQIEAIIDVHAQKARDSQYDRSVAISAIAAARAAVKEMLAGLPDEHLRDQVLARLLELKSAYHDPDGVYTNGKGVIGALIDDMIVETS